jgi:hypothetical protein
MKTTIHKLLIFILIAPSIAHASYPSSDYTTPRYKRVWDTGALCAGAILSGLTYGAGWLANLSFDAYARTPWTPRYRIGHSKTTTIYSPYYRETIRRPLYASTPKDWHFSNGVLFTMAAVGCGIAAIVNFCDGVKGKKVRDYSQPVKRKKRVAYEKSA